LIEWLPTGEARVNARMAVDEVNELLSANLPESDDWDSIGGLILDELGHVPSEGESVEINAWRLTAERVQGRRIGRVRLTPPSDHDAENGADGIEATLRRIAASRGIGAEGLST
jgi:CBS domain containing-hemolysin-like protein